VIHMRAAGAPGGMNRRVGRSSSTAPGRRSSSQDVPSAGAHKPLPHAPDSLRASVVYGPGSRSALLTTGAGAPDSGSMVYGRSERQGRDLDASRARAGADAAKSAKGDSKRAPLTDVSGNVFGGQGVPSPITPVKLGRPAPRPVCCRRTAF
jgi:hypothetical protein